MYMNIVCKTIIIATYLFVIVTPTTRYHIRLLFSQKIAEKASSHVYPTLINTINMIK